MKVLLKEIINNTTIVLHGVSVLSQAGRDGRDM